MLQRRTALRLAACLLPTPCRRALLSTLSGDAAAPAPAPAVAAAAPAAAPADSAAAAPADAAAATAAAPEPLPVLPSWDDFRVEGVTLVRSVREAARVAALVERVSRAAPRGAPVVHAWDTEVTDLDLDTESPVGHGTVICASFYSGPDVDYGAGPRVWVDALGEEGDAVLRAFGGVLGAEDVRKVWHNYGFDRHVLHNHGIDVRGFHGDTMHMARLQNTARLDKATGGGYSLAALSRLLLHSDPKTPMLELFGRYKRKKNGEEGKVRELPHLGHIQRSADAAVRAAWVAYSVRDAEVTWRLHAHLCALLSDPASARWRPEATCFADVQFGTVNALDSSSRGGGGGGGGGSLRDTELNPPTMLELYDRVLRPFGECLTDMERAGIRLDQDAIRAATVAADAERTATIARFQQWAVDFTGRAELKHLNVHSDMQKAQLLFGLPRAAGAGAGEGGAAGGAAAGDEGAAARAAASGALEGSEEAGGEEEEGGEEDEGLVVDVLPPPRKPRKSAAAAAAAAAAAGVAAAQHPLQQQPIASGAAATAAPRRGRPSSRASAPLTLDAGAAAKEDRGAAVARPAPAPAAAGAAASAPPSRAAAAPAAAAAAPSLLSSKGRRDFSSFTALPPLRFHSPAQAALHTSTFTHARGAPQHHQHQHQHQFQHQQLSAAAFIGLDSSTSDSELEWHSSAAGSSSSSDGDGEGEGGGGGKGGGGGGGSGGGESSEEGEEWAPRLRRSSGPAAAASSPAAAEAAPPAAPQGTPLGPTGFLQRPAAPEEDVCPEYEFDTENTDGYVEPGKLKAKKKRPFFIPSLLLPVTDRTPKGRASGTAGAIKKLLARSEGGGSIAARHLTAWGCAPEAAGTAVARLGDLLTISAIDTILETFLKPLAASAASSPLSRVHCSLNLNTETGRLSARRPNLQNQPSLERDRFGIRKSFAAPPGQCLIVADYGQLELRVLAHLTRCRSMIDAFAAGGDFHSRTAIGMYPEVRAAVASGEVLLEEGEGGGGGGGGAALLKDRFKEQRRKAKILNFSIAYGKTAYGLAKDWGVTLGEAEATVKAWYSDRPEVLEWQCRTREGARRTGKVFTMLGRQRDLPGINTRRTAGHAERAAINTPIQGSAADIVMCAMLKVWRDEQLAALGYRMVLQVHDEVVLEGPLEHAPAAQARLVHLMQRPFDAPLLVDLTVDAKTVLRWGDVK